MVASTTAKHIWLRCTCQKEHSCQARMKISLETSDEPFSILAQSKNWHNHMPKHDAQLIADAALRLMRWQQGGRYSWEKFTNNDGSQVDKQTDVNKKAEGSTRNISTPRRAMNISPFLGTSWEIIGEDNQEQTLIIVRFLFEEHSYSCSCNDPISKIGLVDWVLSRSGTTITLLLLITIRRSSGTVDTTPGPHL